MQGRKVFWLKDRIDRNWIRKYTDLRMEPDPNASMRCGGCGAKVGAEVLADALASLLRTETTDFLAKPDPLTSLDDGVVLKPPLGKLLVQSVDHFRAFLDDPFVFGQIAAAHALSDLYAMGAEPWSALAIASVPYASQSKMRAELSAMLQGANEILREAGCALVGGHSAEAAETALGFAVTGLVDSGKILRKAGLQPGDQLLLTKPLGTGIVLAGHMRGNTRAQWLMAAIELHAYDERRCVTDRDGVSAACRDRCFRLRTGRASAGNAGSVQSGCGAPARIDPGIARRASAGLPRDREHIGPGQQAHIG